MKKLFLLKKGNMKFYACFYNCEMYAIERITKSVGMTLATFESLQDLEKYAAENGYKKQNAR